MADARAEARFPPIYAIGRQAPLSFRQQKLRQIPGVAPKYDVLDQLCRMGAKSLGIAKELDTDQVAEAYGRWAPVYDIVFGPVFRRGRRAAVDAAERIGGRILEVGVGTGLSLTDYATKNRITGIDISEPMLEKARKRVARLSLSNVADIAVMDAERLSFPDGSFDVVVAQYVVTAIPNPEKALNEFVRVVRPGGEIILTTRIGAETGLRGTVEKWLMPVTSRLGWRTEFPWARYENWASQVGKVRLLERRALPPMGHFWLVRFGRQSDDTATPPLGTTAVQGLADDSTGGAERTGVTTSGHDSGARQIEEITAPAGG